MRSNRFIIKAISILLIFVLLQKTGGGLYLHNWLHTTSKHSSHSGLPAIEQDSVICTCLDDFYIPFAETGEYVIQHPPTQKIEFVSSLNCLVPYSITLFHSLRGPPSVIA